MEENRPKVIDIPKDKFNKPDPEWELNELEEVVEGKTPIQSPHTAGFSRSRVMSGEDDELVSRSNVKLFKPKKAKFKMEAVH
jgi:hypothetical protein